MPSLPSVQLGRKKILATNWGSLAAHDFTLTRADGSVQHLTREVYDYGSAAAVLLLDPDREVMMLVRQFRLPPHLNGDEGHLLEACAGLLDGDAPQECARRESIEETGIAPRALSHAFDLYASPGSVTEKIHCFIGTYGLADRVGAGGGLAEEDEEIEMVEIGFDAALPMIASGAIVDAKTVALIQHAALAGLLS